MRIRFSSDPARRISAGIDLICSRGHDQVVAVQPLDLVRPPRYGHFAPFCNDHGMMSLGLGQFPNAIGELERELEIFERKLASLSSIRSILVLSAPNARLNGLGIDVCNCMQTVRRQPGAVGSRR
jgi:hypothetical protein